MQYCECDCEEDEFEGHFIFFFLFWRTTAAVDAGLREVLLLGKKKKIWG